MAIITTKTAMVTPISTALLPEELDVFAAVGDRKIRTNCLRQCFIHSMYVNGRTWTKNI